jgi:very-short-patch-repair endonuclease
VGRFAAAARVVCVRITLWTKAQRASLVHRAHVIDSAEALRLLGPKAVLSHEVAARLLGIELVDDPGTLRITVPRDRSRCAIPGWHVVRSDIVNDQIVAEDGLRCTDALRTVADLARVLASGPALASADSALRHGLLDERALRGLQAAVGRGAGRVRTVASEADPKSGSVLESLLRVVLLEAKLPRPSTQHTILDEQHQEVGRVDFCWPRRRLVVEADGFAFHSNRDDFRRDRARMNELERLGWRVLRFTWDDVTRRPAHVTGLVSACLRPPRRRVA